MIKDFKPTSEINQDKQGIQGSDKLNLYKKVMQMGLKSTNSDPVPDTSINFHEMEACNTKDDTE
jgi:hypothetical protein